MEKKPAFGIYSQFTQCFGHTHEVIIVNPDEIIVTAVLGDYLGEFSVNLLVR